MSVNYNYSLSLFTGERLDYSISSIPPLSLRTSNIEATAFSAFAVTTSDASRLESFFAMRCEHNKCIRYIRFHTRVDSRA